MADSNLFSAEVVTPERVLTSGIASQVVLRTVDGDITFLSGHTPLVGAVEAGVVRVVAEDGEELRIAVHGGFVQVEQNVLDASSADTPASVSSRLSGTRVTILAGIAELANEIDIERAQIALDGAEARVAELVAAGGRKGALGSAVSATGEAEEVDVDLVESEAALRRAQVRREAAGVGPSS